MAAITFGLQDSRRIRDKLIVCRIDRVEFIGMFCPATNVIRGIGAAATSETR